jgi:hypothetical protein
VREPTELSTRRHAADEHLGVLDVRRHAQPVAEDRATRKRAGRVDGNHPDRLPGAPHLDDELIDEGTLARARRAGDADQIGAAGMRVQPPYEIGGARRFVLDLGDGARNRASVPRQHALVERCRRGRGLAATRRGAGAR